MSNCWICGAHADSGEHMIKKTDLQRAVSGTVSQKTPIHHRVSGIKKVHRGFPGKAAFIFKKK